MPVLAIVHHLERPFLGHAGPPLRAPDLTLRELHVRRGDRLPPPDAIDGIVSFGGEQSVRDIGDDPQLAAEAAWLRDAVHAGIPVLGVCLGAQLLARAAGARVFRLRRRMLSWEPLELTAEGAEDPVFRTLPLGARGLQWNEDGFDLPPGAVELVRRTAPSCQAFRLGESAWGVQFHPDVDEPALAHWYAEWGGVLTEAGVPGAAARAVDGAHMPRQPALANALFGAFAGVVRRRAARPPRAPQTARA